MNLNTIHGWTPDTTYPTKARDHQTALTALAAHPIGLVPTEWQRWVNWTREDS